MNKTNYSYVGISLIILVFGIIFIPRIIDRITNKDVTRTESRSKNISTQVNDDMPLAFLEINGTPKKIPAFSFTEHRPRAHTYQRRSGRTEPGVYRTAGGVTPKSGFSLSNSHFNGLLMIYS